MIEPSRPGILRGDCDQSGNFSGVPDGLFPLNYQFIQGAPAPLCFAACDADGNGIFNALVDALYIFNFAFVSGSEPIPAPFPDCDLEDGTGFDSIGVLGCEEPFCVFPL